MSNNVQQILRRALDGHLPEQAEALALASGVDVTRLMAAAASIRDAGHGNLISYSRKVFIPLTKLCRDSCHYCTFARPPKRNERAYLSREEVLDIARAGQRAGCHEALFTLGDKPELRYRAAARELAEMGFATTLDYLAAMAKEVLQQTGLLPHLNPGVMTAADIIALRSASVSQGIMLETSSGRLSKRGMPHFGSPDKDPAVRLATIRAAGEARVPFTSGLLIGIGETRTERIEALLALRSLQREYGHIQEIIVQNFRAKLSTRMAQAPEPSAEDHLWTIAVARIIFGAEMNIQAPPNIASSPLDAIAAGINDWGGVSPVTPDHVNPEAPWPEITRLAALTERAGKTLVARLPVYPRYANDREHWIDSALHRGTLALMDGAGFARADDWVPGTGACPPALMLTTTLAPRPANMQRAVGRAVAGENLSEKDIAELFAARGDNFEHLCAAADALRRRTVADAVSYVVNRNINYTNVCSFHCQFCAFSKGKLSANLRGRPYDLSLAEIQRRTVEAWERGATEVCLQGGIHPDYTGQTYLDICAAIKEAVPGMHIHAFSPLEVSQGAQTLGLSVKSFLQRLKKAGLGTLPGTAAEILDDEVRRQICPDKLTSQEWLDVVETAHGLGLKTTATIMYGHVERYQHWARHLLKLRNLQRRTGGITEFVPLPFVPMETPIYLKGRSRKGPTYREAILMHAVARLALHPLITNIQTSWVKMGTMGVKDCLNAGANDLGGTLMNESITRAAGAVHGQELPPGDMEALIRNVGRTPRQRTTSYGRAPDERQSASFTATPLRPLETAPWVPGSEDRVSGTSG
ncbi:MAG: 5-amino-6-(D-ribitylamino)uracil--L-tyrosine 4-hydroxyphenyl transferase CofH [Xanthobacteraceae bacterium]